MGSACPPPEKAKRQPLTPEETAVRDRLLAFQTELQVERGIKLSPGASPLPGYDGVLSTGIKATASSPAIGGQ